MQAPLPYVYKNVAAEKGIIVGINVNTEIGLSMKYYRRMKIIGNL